MQKQFNAVINGKGGVGKSFFAVNFVQYLKDSGIAHIAVLEGRTLVEHYVSMPTDDTLSIDGNIYLGRVQNVLPGMEAAFIDIGTPKNGVLYRGDVSFDTSEVEEAQPKIERLLKNGQPVILNLQGVDRDLQRRLIDFSSGLCYALGGTMEKAAEQVFLLTPSDVEVSQEEKGRLQARGLYRS